MLALCRQQIYKLAHMHAPCVDVHALSDVGVIMQLLSWGWEEKMPCENDVSSG